MMTKLFMPISDGVAHRDGFSPRRAQRDFRLGERGVPARAGARGSPFQMPTRLADGLGLESDLGHGYPLPCAPSSKPFEESGSPALTFRKEGQLRLLTDK